MLASDLPQNLPLLLGVADKLLRVKRDLQLHQYIAADFDMTDPTNRNCTIIRFQHARSDSMLLRDVSVRRVVLC